MVQKVEKMVEHFVQSDGQGVDFVLGKETLIFIVRIVGPIIFILRRNRVINHQIFLSVLNRLTSWKLLAELALLFLGLAPMTDPCVDPLTLLRPFLPFFLGL